ncbi:MAG TPA: NAD(P)-binding domain-containing protein [Candidatus Methylomirabilis sp.]
MIHLDEADVRRLLKMEDLIPAMEKALAGYSAGRVVQPVRQVIPVESHRGFFGLMPALADGLGVKLVSFYPENAGAPTHQAIVALFRPEDGTPQAVMDGRLITEMRTAAVSAAATKHLASPDATVLGILGSGVQARSHVAALRLVRPFDEIRVWSRTERNAHRFAEEVGARVTTAEDAVRGADVVVAVTSTKSAVLKGAWLKEGAHVNSVGANRPDWRELDDDVMRHVLFVDSRAGALQESGDVILSGANIHAELGEVFAGTKPPRAEETTVFKSLGVAIEDVVAAQLVYEAYLAERGSSPD